MNTYIIAEAGVNHNGSLELARKLVEKAREAGADCVKFQTFLASEAVSRFAQKAQYQKETVPQGESQLEMVKRLGILSRLRIPEENMDEMVVELTKILGWVDQLKDVNTDDVLPMNSVVEDMNLRERDDVVTDGDIRDEILANAPESMDGYFLVPKVVE